MNFTILWLESYTPERADRRIEMECNLNRCSRLGIAAKCFAATLFIIPLGIKAEHQQALKAGQHHFWKGPLVKNSAFVDSAIRGRARDCSPDLSDLQAEVTEEIGEETGLGGDDSILGANRFCHDWKLNVGEGGSRLRVGLDAPWSRSGVRPSFDLAVYGPDCTAADPGCPEHLSIWTRGMNPPLASDGTPGMRPPQSQEVFIHSPAPGAYQIRVWALDVLNSDFRMRTKLEDVPKPSPVEPTPPNLRPEPPFDLLLRAPNECEGGSVSYEQTVEPIQEGENPPQQCLRFAFGYSNIGRGAYDLRFSMAEMNASTNEAPARQQIYDSKGEINREDDAGVVEFHTQHGHFHYKDLWKAKLFRVLDSGEIVGPLVENQKQGACGHDWKIAEFNKFYQEPAGTADSDGLCGFGAGASLEAAAARNQMGLSTGWTDIYTKGFPGNYIDIGAGLNELRARKNNVEIPLQGRYLIKFAVNDKEGPRVTETKYDDNFAYTYFEVKTLENGKDVAVLLERGYGRDPWDPNKTVLVNNP